MIDKIDEFDLPERIRPKQEKISNGVINAYVYGRLTTDQAKKVEQMVAGSKDLQSKVQSKRQERLRLRTNIPDRKLSLNARKSLIIELFELTEEKFPPQKDSLWTKFKNFLDKTILEF